MDKLAFKTITSEGEINHFLDRFQNYVGVRLPVDYARKSTIVGAFLQDKMVGGYMLITSPGFRSVIFVPDEIRTSNSFFQKDEFDMMEVNGLWISPTVKSAKQQFSIWLRIMKDIILSKKKYVLLMGDVRNKNIVHIHSLTNPTKLYKGKPHLMTGYKSHDEIMVSYTTRWNIIKGMHRYWREYKQREHREMSHRPRTHAPRPLKQAGAKYS